MGLVGGDAGAQDPQRRHNLDELASRGGDKPWVRLFADGQFPSERTIFRDSLTGAEIWRLTDDSNEDRHDLHDIPAWNADGTAMIVVRSSGVVPEDMWLISADASSVRPIADLSLEHLLDPQLPVDTAARQSFWSWADPGRIYSLADGVVSLIDPENFAKIEIFDLMTSPLIDDPDLPILESADFVLVPPHPRDDRLLFHTASKGRLFTLDLATLDLFEIPTDGRWEMPGTGDVEAGLQHLRWTREPDQSRLFIGQDARVEDGEVIPDSTQYIATIDGSLTDYNLDGFPLRATHPDLTMTGNAFTGCYDHSIWAVGIDGQTLDRLIYSAETTQHHPSSTWDDRWLATDNGLYQGGASPVDLRGFDVEQSIVLMSPDGRSQNVLNYHHSSYVLDESTHPAPTSSPDGTKIAFDSDMLDRAVGDGGDGDGNPDLWLVVARPPAQPRSVRARPQGGGIRVSWKRPLHAGTEIYWNPGNLAREIAGYNVFRALASGGPYEQVNGALITSAAYDDTDVEAGIDYYYVTQSVEHSGLVSGYSREAYASTISRRWNGDVLHYYEAEHGELTLPMVPQFEPESSSGDWFVGTFARVPDPAYPIEPGPAAVTFDIAAPKGGRYDLWVKLKGFDFGGTVEVEVDGMAQAASLTVEPGDWGWVELPTTVRLRGRSSVIKLLTQDSEIGIDMLAIRLGAHGEPPALGNRDISAPAPPSDPRLVSIDGGTKQIVWSASPDKDVRYYNVYCGRDAAYPLGNQNRLRSPQATTMFDWGIPSGLSTVYKITAVDRYGNESEPIVFDPGSQGEESAPEAHDDAWSVDQGGVLSVPPLGVLTNDFDADGDAMTASLVTGVDHGVLELLADGSFQYTPDPVFSGVDRFTYLAGDDVSTSNIATVTITIVGILGGPVANDDAYSTSEDVDLAVPAAAGVLANDTSDQGKSLTAILVSPTQHGSIALSPSGEVDYRPHDDFNGLDSFTYRASDGDMESDVATVTLTVEAVQDAPVAAADAYAVDQEQVLDIVAPGVLANDSDVDGDTLQAQLAANAANGTVVLRLDGSFTYTPDAGFSGTDVFTYTATDGIDTSPPVTVQIDIQRIDQQADFYVSPSGNDSTGDGSQQNPWGTIQKAANTMKSGDRVLVMSGVYPERVSVPGDGLTFEAQGAVEMKGFTAIVDGLTVRGFKIEGDVCDTAAGWGIYVQGSEALLENNHLFNNCDGGIRLFGFRSADPGTSNNIVRGNRAEQNGMVGIQVEGVDSLIEGNEVWNSLQYHPKWNGGAPSWVDADGIRFFGSGHTIRDNYIHDISYDPPENVNPHIDCFQTWGPAANILFEENFCSVPQNQTASLDGSQGFMVEGDGVSEIVIRRNTIEAFRQINAVGVEGITIVNNLLLSHLEFDGLLQQAVNLNGVSAGIFKNNVVLDIVVNYVATPNASVDAGFNSVWRTDGGPLPDAPFADDLWGINPLLNGNYEPQAGSPLIDSGADVGLPWEGAGPDIGRFEWTP